MKRQAVKAKRASSRNISRLSQAAKAHVKQARAGRKLAHDSAQTIAHRTLLIDKAIKSGAGFANPEFARMGHEKLSAAAAAGTAVLGKQSEVTEIVLDFWFHQWQRSAVTAMALAGCRSAGAAANLGARAASDTLAAMVSSGMRLYRSAQRASEAGLKPILQAASANAQRLSREAASA